MNKLLMWIIRYVNFSIIGTFVWFINTMLYWYLLFPIIGKWSWFVTIPTGIIEFTLLTIFNKRKKTEMFEGCNKK